MTEGERELSEITDARLEGAMRRAMRFVALLAAAVGLVLWLVWGWPTAVLLLVGAAISVASLWEWRKLMAVISARLENRQGTLGGARVIVGFFVRLLVAAVVLYVSLKSLHGSVFALLGGLALAVIALAIEAARLVRS